jgi:Mg-chelatase subunit ChlD
MKRTTLAFPKVIGRRVPRGVWLLLLAGAVASLALLVLPGRSSAQSENAPQPAQPQQQKKATPAPQPAAPAPELGGTAAAEINKEGYTLKPKGLAVDKWPTVRFDFSVEKKDPSGRPVVFNGIKAADLQAKLDGRPINIRESDLRLTSSDPTSLMVMIDASGSMVGSKAGGLDKLSAAKDALGVFLGSLGPKDVVTLGSFDEEASWVAEPMSDKVLLNSRVAGLQVDPARSKYTRLYQAVEIAIAQAARNDIRNVIFISDGWEDSPESRKLSGAKLDEFKSQWEQKVADLSRANGVRVFTIAIGDEKGKGLAYVDRQALNNISKGANGGDAAYICVPPPGTTGSCGEEVNQATLEEKLKQTLENIRQSFRYAYSLSLRLNPNLKQDAATHNLWIAATVGTEPRIALPVEYTYTWPVGSKGGPRVESVKVLQPAVFIQTAPATLKLGQVALLYLLLLSVLALMGIMPLAVKRTMSIGRSSGAVSTVTKRSKLVGNSCPNEGTSFGVDYLIKEGDAVITCPGCQTVHHLGCWIFNRNQCMNRTCEFQMGVPANVLSKYGYQEMAH